MKLITATEAIKALPKSRKIHCFAGSLGADWDKRAVVRELKTAKRIAWVDDMFSHDLAVEAGEESGWFGRGVLRFDVQHLGLSPRPPADGG